MRWQIAGVIVLFSLLIGCQESAEISTYEVPKQNEVNLRNRDLAMELKDEDGSLRYADPDPDSVPDRMLVAMMRNDELAWFFKVVGPKEQVDSVQDAFRKFALGIRYSQQQPIWELPTGWTEEIHDASSIRIATITIPLPVGKPGAESKDGPKDGAAKDADEKKSSAGKTIELAVSRLHWSMDLDEGGLLTNNVNRWRRQMTLKPTIRTLLDRDVEAVANSGHRVNFVKLTGRYAPPQRGMQGGRPAPQMTDNSQSPKVDYEVPEGWKSSSGSSISLVAFMAPGGAETTVTVAGGTLLPNVNRWAGQIGAPLFETEQAVQNAIESVPQGSVTGDFVMLKGPQKSIYAVISTLPGTNSKLFFKLTGANSDVAKERENFLAFVKSFTIE